MADNTSNDPAKAMIDRGREMAEAIRRQMAETNAKMVPSYNDGFAR